jgi:hypothetical protein
MKVTEAVGASVEVVGRVDGVRTVGGVETLTEAVGIIDGVGTAIVFASCGGCVEGIVRPCCGGSGEPSGVSR